MLNLVYSRDGVLPEEPPIQYIRADVSPTSQKVRRVRSSRRVYNVITRARVSESVISSLFITQHEGLECGSIVLQFELWSSGQG